MNYDDQAIKDLAIVLEAVRNEVGIHLELEGYDIASGKFLIAGYERDENDIKRWIEIIGANKRLSATLASIGVHIETEHDDLLNTFFDNNGHSTPNGTLQ